MKELPNLFQAQLTVWGINLDPSTTQRLVRYAEVLSTYERANVIGTRDPNKVLLEHVLDSLSCLLFKHIRDVRHVADVGSGGGLPGIPLRISLPGTRVKLLESTGKKVDFLRYAIRELQLSDADPVRVRVEDAGHDGVHRSRYDLCTARAVARLSVIVEYCVPLLEIGGHVLSMKGRLSSEEMDEGERAAEMLGAKVKEIIEVPMLPEIGDKERRLVILEKVRETPSRYPRKPGTPAKNPLGSP